MIPAEIVLGTVTVKVLFAHLVVHPVMAAFKRAKNDSAVLTWIEGRTPRADVLFSAE